jgi:hypothetical protein
VGEGLDLMIGIILIVYIGVVIWNVMYRFLESKKKGTTYTILLMPVIITSIIKYIEYEERIFAYVMFAIFSGITSIIIILFKREADHIKEIAINWGIVSTALTIYIAHATWW